MELNAEELKKIRAIVKGLPCPDSNGTHAVNTPVQRFNTRTRFRSSPFLAQMKPNRVPISERSPQEAAAVEQHSSPSTPEEAEGSGVENNPSCEDEGTVPLKMPEVSYNR